MTGSAAEEVLITSVPPRVNASTLTVVTCATADDSALRRTIASVQAQLGADIEHIVVGGPPTITDSVSTYLPGIEGGPYAAMNAGAKIASGESLAFLGAGDTFAGPASARALVDMTAEHSWGYGRLRIVDEAGRSRLYAFRRFDRRLLTLGVFYVPHPASVIRASLFRDLGGFTEAYPVIADQELFIRASRLHTPRVSDDLIAEFRAGGLSTRSSWEIARDYESVRRSVDGPLGGQAAWDRCVTWAVGVGRSAIRGGRRITDGCRR